jgi:hypothetical protein
VQISVLRGSTATRVSTHDLVVGDIVMLSTGYKNKKFSKFNLTVALYSKYTMTLTLQNLKQAISCPLTAWLLASMTLLSTRKC